MNKIRKEYIIGCSAIIVLVLISLWAARQDWSTFKLLEQFNFSQKENKTMSQADFIQAGPFQVAVAIQPETPKVGKNHVVIQVQDNEGKPIAAAKVRAVGEMAAMGSMSAMYAQADLSETSPGVYEGNFELPMAGSWPLAVDVATDEAHHVDLSFDMATGRQGIKLTTATPTGDIAYHTCSMHPSVKSATPGTCPICGMDLVPVTQKELQSGSIMVDEGRRQTIGVKTGKVRLDRFSVPIRLQGELTFDENRLKDISLRFDGWIGDLNADYVGKRINKGDVLFSVYSPELLALQEEHLQSIKQVGSSAITKDFIAASRQKLSLWGLTSAQINQLETRGQAQEYMPILASQDGVVIEKNIVSGTALKQGKTLLRLANLSTLWLEAYAYEQDLPLIKTGMNAKIRLSNSPGQNFTAKVMQIDPFLGNNTRTARVRLEVDNKSGSLKPGFFASVTLQADLGHQLVIPVDAVLVSGEKRIVFRDMGEGRLQPQSIKVGYSDGEQVVVRDGLAEGDAIVTSGNFLIAAESKLKAGVDQW